ncbi:hypothetical protein Tco_0151527 [Tanacetum coccineum]
MVESGTSYNPRITRINVNGKTAYELKGGFFDDLHKIAFSGTNREDAVEYIKNFLKIVDPIDLLNVSYERLWLVVFPFSLVGSASEWMNKFKGSITSWVDLTDKFLGEYYPPCRTGRIATPMSNSFNNHTERDGDDAHCESNLVREYAPYEDNEEEQYEGKVQIA